jgi:hypothetical protein
MLIHTIVALTLLATLSDCQSPGNSFTAFFVLNRPYTAVYSNKAQCDEFAVAFRDAVAVATGTSAEDVGAVETLCSVATVINQTHSITAMGFAVQRTQQAAVVLARLLGFNAVHALGVVAAAYKVDMLNTDKDEGVETFVIVIIGCLFFAGSTIASVCCFRRSAQRKSRSIKFKELVRFEIEMASASEPADIDGGLGGVPLPQAAGTPYQRYR